MPSILSERFLRNPTTQESRVQQLLAKAHIHFVPQKEFYPYVVDLFIQPPLSVVVEVDGKHHKGARQKAYDATRSYWLRKNYGVKKVIRITNSDVDKLTDDEILGFLAEGFMREFKL